MADIRKTEGIIVGVRDSTETSQIVSMFTKDFGTITIVAKGVKRKKNKFAGRLEIFSIDEIVFYFNTKKGLHTLSECSVVESFENIKRDIKRFSVGSYILEVIKYSHFSEVEWFYEMVKEILQWLDEEYNPLIQYVFEIKYLEYMGNFPVLDRCTECGRLLSNGGYWADGIFCNECARGNQIKLSQGTIAIMGRIVNARDMRLIRRIKLNPSQLEELKKVLRLSIDYIMPKRLKSLTFLEQIQSGKV